MTRILVKIDDYYFEWSTIADAPTTKGMALPLLAHYIAEEYGADGLSNLGSRLERIARTGTSDWHGATVESILATNRAGPGERRLTKEELLRQYVPTPHERGPWDAEPPVSIRDLSGDGTGPWRLFVGDYGVADWPPGKAAAEDPKAYAEEVARCVRDALSATDRAA